MQDIQIVNLYINRDETALAETDNKYGKYLKKIAFNLLSEAEDVEECLNDTYMRAWNTIPPNRPEHLNIYLGKIIRGLSVDLIRRKGADKRGGAQYTVAMSELIDCVDSETVESGYDAKSLGTAVNNFLKGLKPVQRNAFIRRYFFCDSVQEIADGLGYSLSKTKSLLFRMRNALKVYLESEGFLL